MRVLHWLYWQLQTLWLAIERLAGATSDDWNPRLYPDESLAWEAYQRRRRRAASGGGSSAISVPVSKPTVRSAAPPVPSETEPSPAAPPPPAVIRKAVTWDELEGEESK